MATSKASCASLLDAARVACRALRPGDVVGAKMERMLVIVEQRMQQPDWGDKASLKDYWLDEYDDATRLGDSNPNKPLRVEAFRAMKQLLGLWPKRSHAQQMVDSKRRRRQDPNYMAMEEDRRDHKKLRAMDADSLAQAAAAALARTLDSIPPSSLPRVCLLRPSSSFSPVFPHPPPLA